VRFLHGMQHALDLLIQAVGVVDHGIAVDEARYDAVYKGHYHGGLLVKQFSVWWFGRRVPFRNNLANETVEVPNVSEQGGCEVCVVASGKREFLARDCG
jgi:hypothetical protein